MPYFSPEDLRSPLHGLPLSRTSLLHAGSGGLETMA